MIRKMIINFIIGRSIKIRTEYQKKKKFISILIFIKKVIINFCKTKSSRTYQTPKYFVLSIFRSRIYFCKKTIVLRHNVLFPIFKHPMEFVLLLQVTQSIDVRKTHQKIENIYEFYSRIRFYSRRLM